MPWKEIKNNFYSFRSWIIYKNTFPLVYLYIHMYKISFILRGSINQKYSQRITDKWGYCATRPAGGNNLMTFTGAVKTANRCGIKDYKVGKTFNKCNGFPRYNSTTPRIKGIYTSFNPAAINHTRVIPPGASLHAYLSAQHANSRCYTPARHVSRRVYDS